MTISIRISKRIITKCFVKETLVVWTAALVTAFISALLAGVQFGDDKMRLEFGIGLMAFGLGFLVGRVIIHKA